LEFALTTTIHIDVVSDIICPWCFLGKRRLDKALAQLPEIKAEVNFRPFFLDPTIPLEGMDRQTYMRSKFGAEKLKTIHDPLIAAGKEDGVPYAFDKITRTPNTLNAHRLLRWAHVAGSQRTVMEALFMAYWSWGQDISDPDVLATIATVNGLHGEDVKELLATDADKKDVIEEARMVQQTGISGVPTFIFNRKYGAVGAQPVEGLKAMIQKVAAEATAASQTA
jgi:predicted DsbA family dithiol-disulfide isomerase